MLIVASAQAMADDAKQGNPFLDPQDGQLDASEWLLDRKGFLPVPIIITEPAVGYGLGVGLMFVRQSLREQAENAKGGHITPPDIYGIVAAATENGTQVLGGGGMFSFNDDRWRYRGGIAKTHVNLDFYGLGGALNTGEFKIGYELDGLMSSQQVLRRLGESNHYVALRWIYLDLKSNFNSGQPVPAPEVSGLRTRSSGAGLSWEYDTRDNIFTPSRGIVTALDTLFYSPSIGSDNKFETYRAHVFSYLPLGKEFVLGGRLDSRAARGDVPFYQMPYIDMRGVPAARYQDRNAGVIEAELRWNVTPRWAMVGFGGVGRAWGAREKFSEAPSAGALGVGARYLVARRLGLYMGMDIARGPEGDAFYFQVGSAWR